MTKLQALSKQANIPMHQNKVQVIGEWQRFLCLVIAVVSLLKLQYSSFLVL
jgi:hypothetical protein